MVDACLPASARDGSRGREPPLSATPGPATAFVGANGVHVTIEAATDDLAIAAARALRPLGR
jgi:hypothetical protein